MSAVVGSKVNVTVEYANGQLLTGEAIVSTLSMYNDYADATTYGDSAHSYVVGPSHWELNLVGMGELNQRIEFEKRIDAAVEWKCPYCGAINLRAIRKCEGCNAWRPLAYG